MVRRVQSVQWEDRPGYEETVALIHQYLDDNEILLICLCKKGKTTTQASRRIHDWITCVQVRELEHMDRALHQLLDQAARAWIKKEDKTIPLR